MSGKNNYQIGQCGDRSWQKNDNVSHHPPVNPCLTPRYHFCVYKQNPLLGFEKL